eukprot:CAMPEP_0182443724 /NCGR_PEP_ID=MMETSP1172-20130603/2377_1 /TAXON_ID=708627 /ORGANISM="Timspurckia oligopyrenoides, Strain CCMP3278" /LENGTH=411 /DNA_ID=CAMNT_0024639083 /DNA_START=222 /DNA_END=1457 /DNA_ORIENTATION=+
MEVEEEYLKLTPNELHFHQKCDNDVRYELTLESKYDLSPVAFKLETNNSQRYLVIPYCGIIDPSSKINIQVTVLKDPNLQNNSSSFEFFRIKAAPISDAFCAKIASQNEMSDLFINPTPDIVANLSTKIHSVQITSEITPRTILRLSQNQQHHETSQEFDTPLEFGQIIEESPHPIPKVIFAGVIQLPDLLEIIPAELQLPVRVSTCHVEVICARSVNVSWPVMFKLDTNHPQRYAARPLCGVVVPGDYVYIEVEYGIDAELPPDLHDCKDVFRLQAAPLPQSLSPNMSSDQITWLFNNPTQEIMDTCKAAFIPVTLSVQETPLHELYPIEPSEEDKSDDEMNPVDRPSENSISNTSGTTKNDSVFPRTLILICSAVVLGLLWGFQRKLTHHQGSNDDSDSNSESELENES